MDDWHKARHEAQKAYEESKAQKGMTDSQLVKAIKDLLKINLEKRKKKPVTSCWYCTDKNNSPTTALKAAHQSYEIMNQEHFLNGVLDHWDSPGVKKVIKLKSIWLSGYVEGFQVAKTRFKK